MSRYVWLFGGVLFLVAGIIYVLTSGRSYRPAEMPAPGPQAASEAYFHRDQAAPPEAKPQPNPKAALPVIPEDRKIQFTSNLDVVVAELEAAVSKAEDAVTAAKGYIAKSEVKADSSSRRLATFTIRVPVESFRKLVKELRDLGVAERNQIDSEDKTEEVVDVHARIRNLKTEEETLTKLVEKSVNKDELYRGRQELRAIRGEIEQAEARLSTLSRLTALSTIHLTLREAVKGPAPLPHPEMPSAPPTFAERAEQTFGESWALFRGFVQRMALVGVGVAPWLTLLVPAGVVGLVARRRVVRSARETARTNSPPDAG